MSSGKLPSMSQAKFWLPDERSFLQLLRAWQQAEEVLWALVVLDRLGRR